MSVAFRRESDEEHKEPRFELPLPPGENFVTKRGFALTKAKVDDLETLLEGETDEARKADVQRQLRYWRTRLSTAILAPPAPKESVAFGSRVTFTLNGAERTIDIVGDDEAEPASGRIAFSAPLSRALIGAMDEEVIDFGGRSDAIKILLIGTISD